MSLVIKIPGGDEEWDDVKQEFIPPAKDVTITLEHSLYSISKWEAIWQKAYLGYEEKTPEQMLSYIKCMVINVENENVTFAQHPCYIIEQLTDDAFNRLTPELLSKIREYIDSPMTATTIQNHQARPSKKIVTSEEIYYQMIALNIPVEFEHWHLSRLLTLIQVCSIKNDPNPKKMPRADMARQRAALNAKRRAALKSRG